MNKRRIMWGISLCVVLLFLYMTGHFFGRIFPGSMEEVNGTEVYPVDTGREDLVDDSAKRVALTFDDGPHPVYTKRLLEGLSARNVKATFFVVGTMVEASPQLLIQMVEQGHCVGNHTYGHTDIKVLCDSVCIEEIQKNQELVRNLTGYEMTYLRPPFGDWNKKTEFPVPLFCVLWDVDPLDWNCMDADTVVKRVVSKVEDGDIILLHDIYESSVEAALQIVDLLQEQGYEFVLVEQLLLE